MLEQLQEPVRALRDTEWGHDLRDPLTALQIRLGVLEPHLVAASTPSALHSIWRSIRQVERLVGELSGAVDAERSRRPQRTLELGRMVTEEPERLHPLAEAEGVRLSGVVPRELVVVGDATQLARVVQNLVSNAIKFTPRGGREALLSAADTGPGAEAEVLRRGLDWPPHAPARPGQRVAASASASTSHASSLSCIGGRLWVETAPNRGSTLSVALPLAPQAGGARSAP